MVSFKWREEIKLVSVFEFGVKGGSFLVKLNFDVHVSYVLCFFILLQIDDYSLVKFLPMDISDEDTINDVLIQIDTAIQYGEDFEPKEIPVRDILLYN